MSIKVNAECEVSAEDIVDSCSNFVIIKLIKDIDSHVALWEFTEELYNYFKSQMDLKEKDK